MKRSLIICALWWAAAIAFWLLAAAFGAVGAAWCWQRGWIGLVPIAFSAGSGLSAIRAQRWARTTPLDLKLLGRAKTADELEIIARCQRAVEGLCREAGAKTRDLPLDSIFIVPPRRWGHVADSKGAAGLFFRSSGRIAIKAEPDREIFQRHVLHEMMHAQAVAGSWRFENWANEAMTEISACVARLGSSAGPDHEPLIYALVLDAAPPMAQLLMSSAGGIKYVVWPQCYNEECVRLMLAAKRLSEVPGQIRYSVDQMVGLLRRVWLTGDWDLKEELCRLEDLAAKDGQGPIGIVSCDGRHRW